MNKMKELKNLKELLIVVDMVNGFVKEGALADLQIGNIIPGQEKLIKAYIDKNEGIAFIKDSHDEACAEFDEGRFPVHCVKNTYEAEVVDELKPYETYTNLIFEKNSTNGMWAPEFIPTLEESEALEIIELIGCCTDICVFNLAISLKTYFDQHNRRIDVRIIKDLVSTYALPARNDYEEYAYKLALQAGIKVI